MTAGSPPDIAVLGGGAWGTALAVLARRAGRRPMIWARHPDRGSERPARLAVTGDIAALDAPVLLLAVPAKAVLAVAGLLRPRLGPDRVLVSCAKGLEPESGDPLSVALARQHPDTPVAVLSGPTFASEVMEGLPAAATVAAADPDAARRVVATLAAPGFRLYTSADPVGVEIAGTFKNVLAIACGVADGLALGENARAALMTRGLAELARLTAAMGGRPETVMGLAGFGDVVLTCTSSQSRNYSFGLRLAGGGGVAEALAASAGVVEGAATVAALAARGRAAGLDLPITDAVDSVVNAGADLAERVGDLLSRPLPGAEAP